MPLLTIIIPTADRPQTAEPCIRSIAAIAGDIEIVVVDCSQTDALRTPIEALRDSRVRYVWGPPCSMTVNWNRALQHVTGEYVTFIGDDDSLVPSCISVLEQLTKCRPGAIAYPYDATYFWDDFPDRSRAGKLIAIEREGPATARRVNAKASYLSIMRGDHSIPPPVIYHGIVARSVLESIARRFGEVFRTSTPDTYLTGLLSGTLESYLCLSRPLSLFGKSGTSNSARLVRKTEHEHLSCYSAEELSRHQILPPVETVEVLVAESHLRAILALGDQQILDAFHHRYLAQVYVQAMSRNRAAVPRIASHLLKVAWLEEGFKLGQVLPTAARFFGKRIASRLLRSGRGAPGLLRKDIPCSDLHEAQAWTEELFWSGGRDAAAVKFVT